MNLAATMSLNGAGFSGPLAAMRGQLAGAVGSIRGLGLSLTGLGGAFAVFKSGEAAIRELFAAFNQGAALNKLSRATGESVRDLHLLRTAFINADLEGASLGASLRNLQKALGGVNEQGEPTKAIFDQLGLSVAGLQKMRATEQFAAIGEKLRALPLAAQRTAAAMAIFGRSGAEMLALFNDPDAMRDALADASSTAALYERSAQVFAKVDNLLKSLRAKVSGLFAGLAAGLAPALTQVLEAMKALDLEKIGRDLGAVFRAIPAAIRSGEIGELLTLTLQLAFAKGANFFSAAMGASIAGFGTLLDATLSNLGAIADVLIGAAAQFGAALLKAIDKPLAYIQGIFEAIASIDPFKKRSGGVRGLAAEIAPIAAKNAEEIQKQGGTRFGFGGAAMNAVEISAAGKAQAQAGLAALREPMRGVFAELGKIVRDFKVDDIAGASALAEQLKTLVARLAPPLAGGGKEGAADTGPGLLAGAAKLAEGDRLAKIGLFVGAGGPANDYLRRTAHATERMAAIIAAQSIKLTAPINPNAGIIGWA